MKSIGEETLNNVLQTSEWWNSKNSHKIMFEILLLYQRGYRSSSTWRLMYYQKVVITFL